MRKAELVVIGGGVIGASILYHLAKEGIQNVILLEKSLFAAGATGYSGGFIRIYHPDPVLSDMAWASYPHFQHFEQETGYSCGYQTCGVLYMELATGAAAMRAEYERLTKLGAPLEWLDAEEGAARFPSFQWEGVACAIYEPYSGYADPVLTTHAYIKAAADLGAQAYEGVEVEELLIDNQRVTGVKTSIGSIEAKAVVAANGAWAASFLNAYEPNNLYAKRIQIQFYKHQQPSNHPAFIDATTGLYGRPYGRGVSLVGYPSSSTDFDLDIPVPLSARDYPQADALRRVPFVTESGLAGGRRSFDGYTADQRGLLGPSSQMEGLWLAVGWSGGGYKLAPAIGQAAARQIRESFLLKRG